MAKNTYHPGGKAEKYAAKKRLAKRKKGTMAGRLTLGLVTLCNVGLSVALHLLRRREILHAVENDEVVKLLLLEKKDGE